MDKENINIRILNCNCIKAADIEILIDTLNLKYGNNGSGKTTIGKAIYAKAHNNEQALQSLCPYGKDQNSNEDAPKIENMNFSEVKIFNEEYVNSHIFQERSFLGDPFKVFLKSEECEKLAVEIETLLSDLQGIFQKSEAIQKLRMFLPLYNNAVKYSDGEISKRGGVGEFINGNGGGFEKYEELKTYRPFYEKRDMATVSKWAKWRNDGINEIYENVCPFCTTGLKIDEIQEQNIIISKVFKNSALSTANAVLEYIKEAVSLGYIKDDSISILKSYIGESSKADSLYSELKQLAVETDYLSTKIEKICYFRPMNVTNEQLTNIESSLDEMIIEERQVSRFYSTDFINEMITDIEEKISKLKSSTGKLKGLFNRHKDKMENLIEERKEDINHFFSLAGFPYKFILMTNGENKAESYLVPIGLEENRISKPEDHLSWGEKNAFSLVMFMFEAISDNVDLIILDDPITSFDKDKKFAVVRRLFDNKKASFRGRTVLMLTHDLQPVIDCVYGGFFSKFGIATPVKAKWLQNEEGLVKEHDIQNKDLINIFELTRNIAFGKDNKMPIRVVNLRKYIELTRPDFSKTPIYEVLSNIIHDRDIALTSTGEKLEEDIFNLGCAEMAECFQDLSYDSVLEDLKDEKLIEIINGGDDYEKIVSIRLLFERTEGLLIELRRKYPAACKYVNETNHLENDYIFQLNPFKYLAIPKLYRDQLEEFVKSCINDK